MIKTIILILLALLPIISFSQSLTVEKTDQGAWIKEDEENILFYQAKTKSINGEYARANYIHPLYNVDGFELTEDFPKDHLHHRGVFWTWHQVIIGDKHIGDAWECKDFIWDVVNFNPEVKDQDSITLRVKILWKSPIWKDEDGNLKPLVEEKTKIKVFSKNKSYRIIDFEISLLALEEDLKIGGSNDNKGYGGFSLRMKMPKDIMFSSIQGEVEPKTVQVAAGPWMDVSGALANDDGQGGVIMINHRDNPTFPEKWILRKKGSMQNPVFPGREPVKISTSRPTVLRHRLVVYTGKMSMKAIEKIVADY